MSDFCPDQAVPCNTAKAFVIPKSHFNRLNPTPISQRVEIKNADFFDAQQIVPQKPGLTIKAFDIKNQFLESQPGASQ